MTEETTNTTPEATDEKGGLKVVKSPSTPLFPHEEPSEHWDVDFGDSKQVYQGSDLPIWILAGWAAFIIWGLIYLFSGLPTAFQ